MKILIYHGSLSTLTGGEVNTRDWALGLKGRGHKIVIYTVHPGPLAEQIRREGVSIVDAVHLAGYFDQAHLTRSLKRLIGQTPTKIIQGERQLSFLYKTELP